jgi:dihydrofolate reductase
MRKVILQEWISLDGLAADKEDSTEFFNDAKYNVGSDEDLLAFIDTVDTVLLGANTYRMFSQFWPTADPNEEIIADKLNAMPKLVFSQSLDKAPWGDWPEAKVIKDDLVKTITELRQQPGKDMVVWGSLSLAQSLMQAGLVNEYQLRIVPTLLGVGLPLFSSTNTKSELHLLESKTYPAGITLLRYAPI